MRKSSGRSLKQQTQHRESTSEREFLKIETMLHTQAKVNITMENENIVGGMRDTEQ